MRAVKGADAPPVSGGGSRKPDKGGWCRRSAQVRGVRGHSGAGRGGLTVVVAVTTTENKSGLITEIHVNLSGDTDDSPVTTRMEKAQ